METLKPFSLLIKPTSADCNLGCHYCFYLERGGLYPQQTPHRMSDAVVERMISSYMSLEMPSYAFGWQGGEPTLMGVDFFRRVTALQQRHGRRGSIVSNGLQTNATLIDDEFAAHLAQYRFLLGVSVDGPQSVHDTHRVRTSGGGSFDAVMRGIDALQRQGVEFNILVLVSDSNVTRAREVYEFLCAQGYLYHQYIPCVEFDGAGKPLPWTITPQQWGEFLCELFDCWYPTDSRRVSIRCFDALLNYLVNGTYVTCTMGRNCRQYFVVEHNGDSYPCDFFVDKSLRLGSVVTDSWQQLYESAAYRNFGRSKALWNDRCNSCAYLSICSGDCLKHRLWGPTPDPHQLSWLCAGWKRFYDHALLRFEELARTLRAQQPPAAPAPPAAPSPGGASVAGRNEPCLCGSGKKYKKCCGRQ